MRQKFFSAIAAACLLGWPITGAAQTPPPYIQITVVATGSVNATHDEVVMPISYQGQQVERRSDALSAASSKVVELKKKLEDFGLKAGDFSLGQPQVYPVYSPDRRLIGYKSYFSGSVTVSFANEDGDAITAYVAKNFGSYEAPSGVSKKAREAALIEASKVAGVVAFAKVQGFASGVGCKVTFVDIAAVDESFTQSAMPYSVEKSSARSMGAPTFVTDAAATERTDVVTASAKYTYKCYRSM